MDKAIDFKNIVLVCLDQNFCKKAAEKLAEKLEMFVADCKDYIEYDLVDSKTVLNLCGGEYLKEREKKALQAAADFQNTVLSINYDLYHSNYALFNSSLIVVLHLEKESLGAKETVNKIAFETHNNFLKDHANVIVNLDSLKVDSAVKKIIEKLRENL